MRDIPIYQLLIPLGIFVLSAAGCAPAGPEPQQIAAYPQTVDGEWVLPAPPAGGQLVYDAYLAIEVPDPEAASSKAIRIAQDNGGYLMNSYTRLTNAQETITLEIRIPPHNFDAARRAFRSLGTLLRETVSGDWEAGPSGWEQHGQFTLFFQQSSNPFLPRPRINWHPVETFREALALSARLMGALVDLLIWIVVILGPFALIGWGGTWLIRRLQQPSFPQERGLESEASSEQQLHKP